MALAADGQIDILGGHCTLHFSIYIYKTPLSQLPYRPLYHPTPPSETFTVPGSLVYETGHLFDIQDNW